VATFLDEMGLAEHQVIYALHRDTKNCHLHLAVTVGKAIGRSLAPITPDHHLQPFESAAYSSLNATRRLLVLGIVARM